MNLYFEESGDMAGPTIIFIHGGGVGGWMWEKQLKYFAHYHCLVPDLPGHGKSMDAGPVNIHNSAVQIAELIETHAHAGKAHVVGHSLGAKVIVELLSIRPELVESAVVASALFRPIRMLKWTHKPWVYRFTASMLKHPWYVRRTVRQFKFPSGGYNAHCLEDFSRLTADSLYATYEELYAHLDLPSELDKAGVPVLVLAGEREPAAMKLSVSDITSVLPHAKGIILKKALHTYPWTMHEDFNSIVAQWLSGDEIEDEKAVPLAR